jgi:hypothetical protein
MQPWHCRPRDTTEISTISSLLPATIIVCAPTTHDQESVGTIIVAGLSVALMCIWCQLSCRTVDKFGRCVSLWRRHHTCECTAIMFAMIHICNNCWTVHKFCRCDEKDATTHASVLFTSKMFAMFEMLLQVLQCTVFGSNVCHLSYWSSHHLLRSGSYRGKLVD